MSGLLFCFTFLLSERLELEAVDKACCSRVFQNVRERGRERKKEGGEREPD